jgi:hypothetical protein
MRKAIMLACILFQCVLAVAWGQGPPSNFGIAMQTWHYDPQTHVVTVALTNTSQKDITAYQFTARMDYADGTSSLTNSFRQFSVEKKDHDLMLLPEAPKNQVLVLLPGATKDELLPVAKDVTNVSILVGLVAFSDLSANVQDERAFNRLIAMRKAEAMAIRRVNEIIRQSLTTSAPSQNALTELERLSKVYNAKIEARSEEENAENLCMRFQLSGTIATLKGAANAVREQNMTESVYLENFVKQREERAAASELHAGLTRVPR